MTGCVKNGDKFREACDMYIIGDSMNYVSIMKANGYAAWIYTALRYVGECDYVKSIEVEADSFMSPETDQDEAENMTVEASEAKLDKELYDHVKNGLEFRYGYRHSGLKSKMSITEIKRLQAHGEDAITPDILTSREYSARSEVPIPAFMSEERIVHGNEIGNIYHKIMELADFSGKTLNIRSPFPVSNPLPCAFVSGRSPAFFSLDCSSSNPPCHIGKISKIY